MKRVFRPVLLATTLSAAGKKIEQKLNEGLDVLRYKVYRTPDDFGRVTIIDTITNHYSVVKLESTRVKGSKRKELPWDNQYTIDSEGYAVDKNGKRLGKVYIRTYESADNYRKSYKSKGEYAKDFPIMKLVDTDDEVSIEEIKDILS